MASPSGREDAGAVEHMIGAARGGARLLVRPALARIDEAEIDEAEIRHGARCRADILAELRLDQHDCRAVAPLGRLGIRHGRCLSD